MHLTNGCTRDREKAQTLADTVQVLGGDAEVLGGGPRDPGGAWRGLPPCSQHVLPLLIAKSTGKASPLLFVRAKIVFGLFDC